MGGMPAPKPLTDAQKQTVKDLFKKYDIKKLTAADLKSIMESLDKAGIHGPTTREAMELVGITEGKSRSLTPAPPPPGGACLLLPATWARLLGRRKGSDPGTTNTSLGNEEGGQSVALSCSDSSVAVGGGYLPVSF